MKTPFNKEKVYIGITPTSWWNDDFLDIDIGIPFEQCVSEMALAGYEGCSVGHKYPKDPEVLKYALDIRGLRVSEPWTSTYFTIKDMYDKTVEDFNKSLEFIKSMGGTDIVVAELGGSSHQQPIALKANKAVFDDEQWQALADGLNHIGKIATDNGMNLCYHHHMGTGVMTRPEVDRLMEMTNPAFVHLLFDTGHIRFAGGDPLEMAMDYAHRIKHVHLKNIRQPIMNQSDEQEMSFKESIEAGIFTVPGDEEGCINFEPIFETLAENNFEGWLVVEAEQNPANAYPLKYAKMGREYIRKVTGI
ncbi:myo-inosose-2 dehydratase [Flammeovirga aprica]|uniref:Myo-inosose-2 dehydratase n=1 Tax=Flammeovirga aprica JL-4 TaxID=694437 RepID=A0A7X9NZY6_9BACT|nr:myo-inosose-2 dehydratase [Flammeovirga aprica]NME66983.1 myo-inosose-2 dehydratase [Flammeovirga aprica JL-4]